jgi:hypothetical protein
MSTHTDPFAAGPVTNVTTGAVGTASPVGPTPRGSSGRPAMWWYRAVAGGVLAVGLVVVLVLVLNGQLGSGHGPLAHRAGPPNDVAPPLAKLCPAPSGPAPTGPAPNGPAPNGPAPNGPAPSGPPAGERTVDTKAGISYQAYGDPWRRWTMLWADGTLGVPYEVGQYFVTEQYPDGTDAYLATILSGPVPATVNDSVAIDIECTGKQVAADVRASYYPGPNTMDVLRAGRSTLGGRPAWVSVFRLHFEFRGLRATDELVGVATIDVGRPTAAVLYVSIPGTHRQWDHVVTEVLDSVRPL